MGQASDQIRNTLFAVLTAIFVISRINSELRLIAPLVCGVQDRSWKLIEPGSCICAVAERLCRTAACMNRSAVHFCDVASTFVIHQTVILESISL